MDEASALQRPLPDGSLEVVLRGPQQDSKMDLVNLAAEASRPHASFRFLRAFQMSRMMQR